jgi:hypothetical protein
LVGPNPYALHSFRELRAVMGRPYVVCRPCRRFVALGNWLDGRDSRATTFSCSICGGAGTMVFDDPVREGLQHDPRPNPPRHQMAAARLQTFHRLADPLGHRAAARGGLPQREKPRYEPARKYRLVPLPIRTFREAFDFGLALRIHCPGCHAWRPIELMAERLDLPFAGARFICARVKRPVYGDGTVVCGSLGEVVFDPVERPDRDRTVVDIQCGGTSRRHHSRWEITGIDLQAVPWAGRLLGNDERFRCPGCGSMPRHTFHAPYPHRPSAVPGLAEPSF